MYKPLFRGTKRRFSESKRGFRPYKKPRFTMAPRVLFKRRRRITQESRAFDHDSTAKNLSYSTPYITQLNGISLGDDNFKRNGKDILMQSLQFKGQVHAGATMVDGVAYRIAIILDKRPGAALPQLADMYQNLVAAANDVNCLTNINSLDRFKVLKEFQGTVVNTAGPAPTADNAHDASFYLKMKDIKASYGLAGAGTYGSIQSGALLCVAWAGVSNAGGAGTMPILNGQWRLRFVDR